MAVSRNRDVLHRIVGDDRHEFRAARRCSSTSPRHLGDLFGIPEVLLDRRSGRPCPCRALLRPCRRDHRLSSLLSMLTSIRLPVTASISRNVGMVSSVTAAGALDDQPALLQFGERPLRRASPLQVVVRSSQRIVQHDVFAVARSSGRRARPSRRRALWSLACAASEFSGMDLSCRLPCRRRDAPRPSHGRASDWRCSKRSQDLIDAASASARAGAAQAGKRAQKCAPQLAFRMRIASACNL